MHAQLVVWVMFSIMVLVGIDVLIGMMDVPRKKK